MKLLEKLNDKYEYLKFKTNWHKHPWLSKLFCSFGRHDYEGIGYDIIDFTNSDIEIYLECFYCEHRKTTILK